MYSIEILPIAQQDLTEIARYVAVTLDSPQAAERLAEQLIDGIRSLRNLPCRRPVYHPIRNLEHEYRALRVENYLVFYWVDENPQLVTVARVIYAKSDIAAKFPS